jgi:hypothetical protein
LTATFAWTWSISSHLEFLVLAVAVAVAQVVELAQMVHMPVLWIAMKIVVVEQGPQVQLVVVSEK